MSNKALNHRERLEVCMNGDKPDRVPVALWRHFPVDDQSAEGMAAATIAFQRAYDFDLVKVTSSSTFWIKDWGVQDAWRGSIEGTRDITKFIITRPEDWEKLPVLDPKKGEYAIQIECLKHLVKEFGKDTPVIQTVFSPLLIARNLVSREELLAHARRYPDAFKKGIQTIAETARRFVEVAMETGIAGIFYGVQHADYHFFSKTEYLEFGLPFDQMIMEPAAPAWFNMVHLHGEDIMFDLFADFPMAAVNWHDRDTYPNLAEAKKLFRGVVCGGLQRQKTMLYGTPESVTQQAKDAIKMTDGKRFILGTGCVLPITTPHGNIVAACKSVE
jgi:uroporphyrinogen decarboxylase